MTSATADVRPDDVSAFTRIRHRFRDWRHRPFWGGLLTIIAGFPILYFPYAHLSIGGLTFAMATTGGAGALIIGILMMVLGVTAWVQPMSRVFAGVATILLALVSIPVSNLGGFGLGLIPGLVGGGMMASWAPLKERPPESESESESESDKDADEVPPAGADGGQAELVREPAEPVREPAEAATEPGALPPDGVRPPTPRAQEPTVRSPARPEPPTRPFDGFSKPHTQPRDAQAGPDAAPGEPGAVEEA